MTTVTVCIPAYNEETNIQNLLRSVIRQKEVGFKIEKIIVLSDGSTDKTVQNATGIKDKRIEVLDYKIRKGKSYHLNTFPKIVDSDVLVFFDADVELEGTNVIKKLIEPIQKNKLVGMVSANFTPVQVKNFLQKSIESTINVFEVLRHEFKNGNNALGCTGRIQALSKPFYKVLYVPHKMVLNDIYTYFDCINKGFEFRHIRTINVDYQLPNNIKDYLSQFKRFCVGSKRMEKIFDGLYQSEYSFSKKRYYELMFKEFIKRPIHCLFIFGLNKIGYILACREIETMNGKWDEVKSTKSLQQI